ncbi:MAG: hypothetical protein KGJ24_03095, partial [Burkholderiales bacterium]|nr:hypothetical protein [Burkholderiales bacterium]
PGRPWRVVSSSAQRLPPAVVQADFAPLAPAAAGSACGRLGQGWPAQAGFRGEMFEGAGHCFAVARGNPPAAGEAGGGIAGGAPAGVAGGASAGMTGGASAAGGATPREQVLVAVFDRPDAAALAQVADNPPAPIASLPQFARIEPADRRWRIGVRGAHAGWLALGGPDAGGRERWLAAPWSTCALWRLGRDLLPAATPASGGRGDAAPCQDR